MLDKHIEKYTQALEFGERQVASLVEKHPDFFPIYTVGGKWHHGGELWTDWTGGFLAGMMWQFHLRERAEAKSKGTSAETLNTSSWRKRAEHYSKLLEHRQYDRDVH